MRDSQQQPPPYSIDPLLPSEMAAACERVGVRKANMDAVTLLTLAGLAGAFISLGATFFTLTVTGSQLGYGPTRLLGGAAFSLGLVLVIIAGAELFTGNTLIIMAWASRKVSTGLLLRNWALSYVGNFAGAVLTVLLVYGSRHWEGNGSQVGATALAVASAKVNLDFGEAVALGILCNALVGLAVWLSLSGRSNVDKVLGIIFPISAFVAAGFEHSIANMYFIPLGILLRGETSALTAANLGAERLADLTWAGFIVKNLAPVTAGNIIGGALLVGVIYWFVFQRPGARRGG